jgi:hypothetical protein
MIKPRRPNPTAETTHLRLRSRSRLVRAHPTQRSVVAGKPPSQCLAGAFIQDLLRAMKPISRSQRNDGFRADSGPSRSDPRRPALRPTATAAAAVCYDRSTSTPAVRLAFIRDVQSLLTNVRWIGWAALWNRPCRYLHAIKSGVDLRHVGSTPRRSNSAVAKLRTLQSSAATPGRHTH